MLFGTTPRIRFRLKLLLSIIAAVGVVAACLWFWAASLRSGDSFAFLQGHSAFESFTERAPSDSPWAYRVYSWNEDYSEVVRKAEAELEKAGYVKQWKGSGASEWIQGNRYIIVTAERVVGHPAESKAVKDQHWATVVIGEMLREGPVTDLRLRLWPKPK